jgi:hypothetical protein
VERNRECNSAQLAVEIEGASLFRNDVVSVP